jgi:hypothetical protein
LGCRIHIVVAPVDLGTASWAGRPAVQKALLSERRKMDSGYRAAEENRSPPQVHQSAGKGGISMVILACPLDMACGLSSIGRSGIRASEVVYQLRYCLGRDREFRGLLSTFIAAILYSPPLFGCRHFELSSSLCRQSWILSKHSRFRMHRLRST